MGETGEFARFIANQDGVVTTGQAAGFELTASDIRGRVGRGEWVRVASGVFRLASAPYSERAMVRAAAWVLNARLDRTTAAWWHGLLPDLPKELTVSMTYTRNPDRWTDCAVDVRKRAFCAEDCTEADGVKVVGRDLSVLGSVGLLDDPTPFVEELLFRKEVTLASLTSALRRNPRMTGLGPARELLSLLDSNTQAKAEKLFRSLLTEHDIPACVQQHRFHGWPLDFAWPERKVVVEVDGFAFHRGHKKFQSDMAKRNALALDGWLVLTFSYHDIVNDPIGCIETLIAALRARPALVG
ncbi:MAG: type IV toxin-antitoxin system AbiEi family antitoxin domain-containing protein [Gordonia sp. (in: high G+C Gram-positive bacteria)]|uniref:DUF559 domain-containing protein n=1 Tax=Gordonia sp. (in: high G+C Gram-positive bacteria) TaxID=84139 RepID=UPI003BB5C956